jgi:glutaconate CoA-transferase subunit B
VRSTPGWQPDRGIVGPELCISPAGIFDFPAPDHRMRLIHHRPGWTPDEIAKATGFELIGLKDSTPVEMPAAAEIETLRTRIDPEGNLR